MVVKSWTKKEVPGFLRGPLPINQQYIVTHTESPQSLTLIEWTNYVYN